MKILMVCLGNICRSPLAEGILRKKLNDHRITWVDVDSAGTSGYHSGQNPDKRSVTNARKNGVDISQLVSRKFTAADYDNFDRIYVMDHDNYSDVIALAKHDEHRNKVDLFLNISAPGKNKAVPDPWYGGEEGFQHVFDLVDANCDALIAQLKNSTMNKGTLFLIPVALGEEADPKLVLPQHVIETARQLRYYIAENPKTCRAFLKAIEMGVPLQEIMVESYGKHDRKEISPAAFLKPLLEGKDVGLVSEAGCPAVADPGSEIVRVAHEKGIKVVPLTGPSSLLLALMASGFSGQQFRFHGYLPIDPRERDEWIREMEFDANKNHITQIFIETPFRNMQLFDALMKTLRNDTSLCVASEITLTEEKIITKEVKDWKKGSKPELHKIPVVFLIGK